MSEFALNPSQSSPAQVPNARSRIARLASEMETLPQVDIPVDHTFGPGFYARTIEIKAGTTLVGKVHATEHIFLVSKGDITLVTEDGHQRVKAGFQMVCRPGMQRAGFAHEDTTCTNIHITPETDLARLEAVLIDAGTIGHSGSAEVAP